MLLLLGTPVEAAERRSSSLPQATSAPKRMVPIKTKNIFFMTPSLEEGRGSSLRDEIASASPRNDEKEPCNDNDMIYGLASFT